MALVAFNFKVKYYLGKINPTNKLLRRADYAQENLLLTYLLPTL